MCLQSAILTSSESYPVAYNDKIYIGTEKSLAVLYRNYFSTNSVFVGAETKLFMSFFVILCAFL